MNSLPLALQALVWTYALVAGGTLLGCLALIVTGSAHGRHRRRAEPLAALLSAAARLWRDLVGGFANGAEWLIYGGRA